jgi:hypothetical protein
MELLPAIVGLAALDSVNPSALLATVALLLRGRPARPLVAVYVAAVLVTYFAIGLALTLGVAVTALELPTALPYLGAVGAITRADLAVTDWLPLLVTYNLIFVLPPLLLLAGHVVLGERAGGLLERLRDRMGGTGTEALLWVLGLVGFFLLADALGRFQVIG